MRSKTKKGNLEGIDFKVQVAQLNDFLEAVSQSLLEIRLSGTTAGVCCHHAGHRRVCPHQGSHLTLLKLLGQNSLEKEEKKNQGFCSFALLEQMRKR